MGALQTPQALRGLTVVVTRALDDAGPLRDALLASGAQVHLVPCVTQPPLAWGPAQRTHLAELLPSVRWVAFASRRGVTYFHQRLSQDSLTLEHCQLAAVGPATAAAATAAFGRPCVQAQPPTGIGLAGTLMHLVPEGDAILLPGAKHGRPELCEHLRAYGHRVHVLPLYDTVTGVDASSRQDVSGADFVLFASPSAVQGFMASCPWPPRGAAVSIGPTTTEAVLAAGLPLALTAPSPTVDALVASLAAHVAKRHTPLRPGP